MSLIKNLQSGRARQLPGDLRGCLMSSNTMSVATFALSAPLEDGTYSKEENIFKIEAGLLGLPQPPPLPPQLFLQPQGSLWEPGGGCFPSLLSQERARWEIYQMEQTTGTSYCLGPPENVLIFKEMSQRAPPPPPPPFVRWEGPFLFSFLGPCLSPRG